MSPTTLKDVMRMSAPSEKGEIVGDRSDAGAEPPSRYVPSGVETQTRAPEATTELSDSTFVEQRWWATWDEYESETWLTRRVGSLINRSPDLVLTLLSFLSRKEPVPVDELLEMGKSPQMFDTLFSLYDLGLLSREGANLITSDHGSEVLRRMGLGRNA